MAPKGRSWSPAEDEWLLQNAEKTSLNQMTIALKHSRSAIEKRLTELRQSPQKRKDDKAVSASGRRRDIKCFVRSSWEANVLRVLNYLKKHGNPQVKSWQYEPYTFWFEEIKRKKGSRFYTPDVYVKFKNGRAIWIEVKGYLRPGDRTKLKRFKRFYPEDFEKLVAVVGSDKTESYQFFRKLGVKEIWLYKDLTLTYRSVIPHWEK